MAGAAGRANEVAKGAGGPGEEHAVDAAAPQSIVDILTPVLERCSTLADELARLLVGAILLS